MRLPSDEALRTALEVVGARELKVIERSVEPHASTFDCEVVTCRVAGGRQLRVFAKHGSRVGPSVTAHVANGYRGGVDREARVYQELLAKYDGGPTARYLGRYHCEVDSTWLFLEYLGGAQRISRTAHPGATMVRAARWIGAFHAAHPSTEAGVPFIGSIDREAMMRWVERSATYTAPMSGEQSWFGRLCDAADDWIPELLAGPQSVIHGEFYPANILFGAGNVYPIDWESASNGPGEIDLAMLTEGWPSDVVEHCDGACVERISTNDDPQAIGRRLGLARVLCGLMWLGDTRTQALRWPPWRAELLHADAEKAGLIR